MTKWEDLTGRRPDEDEAEETEDTTEEVDDNEPVGYLRDRKAVGTECDLNPETLVGSWYHSRFDAMLPTEQGLVVAEPQPGVYLVQCQDDRGFERQYLTMLNDMVDERWEFYDTAESMREAWARMVKAEREEVE